jgi:hypothetical protein
MSVAGVIAGGASQPDDGVAMGADEATGLADAVALGEVVEDGRGLLLGHAAVEQRSALALGAAGLAGLAIPQSDVVILAVAVTDGEVAGVAPPVQGASGILAAEAGEVVQGDGASRRTGWVEVQGIDKEMLDILRHLIAPCSIIPGHHPQPGPSSS